MISLNQHPECDSVLNVMREHWRPIVGRGVTIVGIRADGPNESLENLMDFYGTIQVDPDMTGEQLIVMFKKRLESLNDD